MKSSEIGDIINDIVILESNSTYRFGDIIYAKGYTWESDRWEILHNPLYHGTILYEFLQSIPKNQIYRVVLRRPFRAKKKLSRIIKESRSSNLIDIPSKSTLLVHLRAGDIFETNGPLSSYHTKCYLYDNNKLISVIENYLKYSTNIIDNIEFVTAMHYGTKTQDDSDVWYKCTAESVLANKAAFEKLFTRVSEKFNLPLKVTDINLPEACTARDFIDIIDRDAILLSLSPNVILDVGGFAKMCREVREFY